MKSEIDKKKAELYAEVNAKCLLFEHDKRLKIKIPKPTKKDLEFIAHRDLINLDITLGFKAKNEKKKS